MNKKQIITNKNKPDELLDQAWAKPKLKHRAKNVLALVNRSTCFSRWVVSSILWQDTLKGRIRALTKLINIAEVLFLFPFI